MPDLITTYALQTGLQIGSPMPFEQYHPLPAKKYVIFNASSGMPAKNYDYFNDVIRLLRPILADYEFIQLGNKDDIPLNGVLHLHGRTNIGQMQFLLRHSSLLIGNDSSAVHIASAYGKPLVALYGSTHPKIHGPHWGNKTFQRLLTPNRKGKKPTYSPQENPKTVNQIFPETVARAALEALRIDATINMETLHIGVGYHATTLELVCDQVVNPKELQGVGMTARLDYHFNEQLLFQNLSARKLAVVTDKPISIEPLKQLRPNLIMVAYAFDHEYDKEFISNLRHSGIPYNIVSTATGDELAKAKLDLFDLGAILPRKKVLKEDLENSSKFSKNTVYRSNRFILSSGKTFLNRVDLRNGESCNGQLDNERPVLLDEPLFWEDADYYHIYEA